MKKSLITMLVAIVLVAAVGVGATLAFLTDSTKEKVNTFTVGNVDIELTENECLMLATLLDQAVAQASLDLGIDAQKTNDLRLIREKILNA